MSTLTVLRRLQDRLAFMFGCEPASRDGLLRRMLARSVDEVVAYWFQLCVAAGIATLGLVLGSNAVIIGAMLVAPLMGPIVGLGMGLASGSPVLVLRSAGRVGLSVLVVVGLGTGLTRLVPFHELNSEIAARTTPTALDLGVAVFCAMAGVFAALRPASDVATTAAGTSIGISLVPPLCACGFGLGTSTPAVATGAMLLFLTNFAAIVSVATAAFAATGFAQVDTISLESAELDMGGSFLARPVPRRIAEAVRWALGRWLRLAMPMVLLAALYAPLRRGLDQVAWQIEARAEVQAALGALPNRVVQSRIRIEREEVSLVMFLLGDQAEAARTRDQLRGRIAAATGVDPTIEVFAVPDASEFEALERTARRSEASVVVAPPAAPAPPPPPTPAENLEEVSELVRSVVERRWPRATAGAPLLVALSFSSSEALGVRVVHLGPALDATSQELVTSAFADDLGVEVVVQSDALPAEPIALDALSPAELSTLARALATAAAVPAVSTCLVERGERGQRRPSAAVQARRQALEALLEGHPRLSRRAGSASSLSFRVSGCEDAKAPAAGP